VHRRPANPLPATPALGSRPSHPDGAGAARAKWTCIEAPAGLLHVQGVGPGFFAVLAQNSRKALSGTGSGASMTTIGCGAAIWALQYSQRPSSSGV
jgi:hypothetical protein